MHDLLILRLAHVIHRELFALRAYNWRAQNGSFANDSGAGYIERNWPPALKDAGAWPLTSLRQSFLNGALTRLLDPDTILRRKIVEFIEKGDFGLAYGHKPDC